MVTKEAITMSKEMKGKLQGKGMSSLEIKWRRLC